MSTCRLSPRNPQAGGCLKEWTGTQAAHCVVAGCHQTFNSNASADLHYVKGKHTDPSTLPYFDPTDRFGNPYWTVDPDRLAEWKARQNALRGSEVGILRGSST